MVVDVSTSSGGGGAFSRRRSTLRQKETLAVGHGELVSTVPTSTLHTLLHDLGLGVFPMRARP